MFSDAEHDNARRVMMSSLDALPWEAIQAQLAWKKNETFLAKADDFSP